MNSHVEEFIYSRSAFKVWRRVGKIKDSLPVDRGGGCTRILGALTKQPLLKEDDWPTLSFKKLGIQPHHQLPAMNEPGPVAFGNEPFFGALAVALSDLTPDFGGDLLTLSVLDLFASRYNVPFSLSKVWEKLLNASEAASYIIRYGKGYQIDIADGTLASELESIAQSSLSRQQDLKARSSLLAVLQDMITELDADDEDDILAGEIYSRSPRAPDPNYESEAY